MPEGKSANRKEAAGEEAVMRGLGASWRHWDVKALEGMEYLPILRLRGECLPWK